MHPRIGGKFGQLPIEGEGATGQARDSRSQSAEAGSRDEFLEAPSPRPQGEPPPSVPGPPAASLGFEATDLDSEPSAPTRSRRKPLNAEDVLLAAQMLQAQGEGRQDAFLRERGMLHQTAQKKRTRVLWHLEQEPRNRANQDIAAELATDPKSRAELTAALNLLRPDWLRLSEGDALQAGLQAVLDLKEEVRHVAPLLSLLPHEFEARLALTPSGQLRLLEQRVGSRTTLLEVVQGFFTAWSDAHSDNGDKKSGALRVIARSLERPGLSAATITRVIRHIGDLAPKLTEQLLREGEKDFAARFRAEVGADAETVQAWVSSREPDPALEIIDVYEMMIAWNGGRFEDFGKEKGIPSGTARDQKARVQRELAKQPPERSNDQIARALCSEAEAQAELLKALEFLRPEWLRPADGDKLQAATQAIVEQRISAKMAAALMNVSGSVVAASVKKTALGRLRLFQEGWISLEVFRGVLTDLFSTWSELRQENPAVTLSAVANHVAIRWEMGPATIRQNVKRAADLILELEGELGADGEADPRGRVLQETGVDPDLVRECLGISNDDGLRSPTEWLAGGAFFKGDGHLKLESIRIAAESIAALGRVDRERTPESREARSDPGYPERIRVLTRLALEPPARTNEELAQRFARTQDEEPEILRALNVLRPDWLTQSHEDPITGAVNAVLSHSTGIAVAAALVHQNHSVLRDRLNETPLGRLRLLQERAGSRERLAQHLNAFFLHWKRNQAEALGGPLVAVLEEARGEMSRFTAQKYIDRMSTLLPELATSLGDMSAEELQRRISEETGLAPLVVRGWLELIRERGNRTFGATWSSSLSTSLALTPFGQLRLLEQRGSSRTTPREVPEVVQGWGRRNEPPSEPTPPSLPDEETTSSGSTKDEGLKRRAEHFDALVAPVRAMLFRHAMKFTGNRDRAEDLVQETLWRALRRFDPSTPVTNPEAWLYTILRWTFLDSVRRPEREKLEFSDDGLSIFDVEPSTHTGMRDPQLEFEASDPSTVSVELLQGIEELTETQRNVLDLLLAGLSHEEIAEELNTTVPAVTSALQNGRAKVARRMADELGISVDELKTQMGKRTYRHHYR